MAKAYTETLLKDKHHPDGYFNSL